jgi:hypothetical protein
MYIMEKFYAAVEVHIPHLNMQCNGSRNSPRGSISCTARVILASGVVICQMDAHRLYQQSLQEHVSCSR